AQRIYFLEEKDLCSSTNSYTLAGSGGDSVHIYGYS
ncbi:hypothetical protein L917_17635, partial [Phytophthora nicotianae]